MSSISDVGSAQIGISGPVPEAVKPKGRKTAEAPTVADQWYSVTRLGGLSRFAFAITVLNIAGHLFLGFEQSWITPFVALAAAYGTEWLGETADAAVHGRAPRYRGSAVDCIKFFLSAHITGLAVGM